MTESNNFQNTDQPELVNDVIFKKHRKQKKRALVLASLGFIFMAFSLSFIDGVTLANWSIGFASTIGIWGALWLVVHFKLDLYLKFDPRFLLVPAACSGILICIFIHVFPELRLLLLSGWYTVLLFGAGQLNYRNVIYLNIFMCCCHIVNVSLLIAKGLDFKFLNELALFLPYIVVWSYIAAVLENIKKGRDENREMRKMMTHLLIKKDQLLTDVSHELSTPLTVLKLRVEALKDNMEDDVNASYDALDVKLNDLQKLINDIHEFSQSNSGNLKLHPSEFNLHDSVNAWQNEIELSVESNQLQCEVINDIKKDVIVFLDQDKLKQVVVNLIANSIKYTDKPGTIKMQAKIVGDKIQLIIEDSAPNISDKHLGKIFDRFYRVDSSRNRETGGAGLGLSICKSLMESQNGTIYASQSDLGGVKMTIELPV